MAFSPARYTAPAAPISPLDKYKYQADQRRRVLDQNRLSVDPVAQYPAEGYYGARALYGGYPYGGDAYLGRYGAPVIGSSVLRSGRYVDDYTYGGLYGGYGGYYGGLPLAREYLGAGASVVPTSGAPIAASQYTYSTPALTYGAGYGYPVVGSSVTRRTIGGARYLDSGAYYGSTLGGYYGGAGRYYGDYLPSTSVYGGRVISGAATVVPTSGAPVAASQYTYSTPALTYGAGYGYPLLGSSVTRRTVVGAGAPLIGSSVTRTIGGARYIDDGYYGNPLAGYYGGVGPRIYGDYIPSASVYGGRVISSGAATVVPTSGAPVAASQYTYSRPALGPVTYGGVPLRGGYYGGGARYLEDISYGAPLTSVSRLGYYGGLGGRYYDDAYIAPRGYGYADIVARDRVLSPARAPAAAAPAAK